MDYIQDFLKAEIMDIETYKIIYDFIALDNFRYGEYEGNQYVIRKINHTHIQIEDEVATLNTNVPRVQTYHRSKILSILERYKELI